MDASLVQRSEEAAIVSVERSSLFTEKKSILAQNENDNNLHSGPNAFEKKLWKAGRNLSGEELQ